MTSRTGVGWWRVCLSADRWYLAVGTGCNNSVAGRQPLSSRVNRDTIGLLVLGSGDDRLVTGDRAKVPAVEGVRVGWSGSAHACNPWGRWK